VRLGLLVFPHVPWTEALDLGRHAEATGWDGLWLGDHLGFVESGAAASESWTTIAGFAATIPRVTLGHMVVANTLRHPALVAKMAATVDRMSGGRLVLGLGAGGLESEHLAYGIPFHTPAERLRRLDESCTLIRSLLDQPQTTFLGRYYQAQDAPCEPKPVQKRLPLLVASDGEKLGLRIVARHADRWNTAATPEGIASKATILERYCAEIGRDPKTIRRSAVVFVVFGDAGRVAMHRFYGPMADALPTIRGDGDELRSALGRYRDAGVDDLVVCDVSLGADRDEKKRAMDSIASVARR
jgi:alkanesulfonate monooxygenase SsuD/methylene tetrahydromethanopterin reductase-like flavin-dependent oxidoreductase (luciferase family)